MTEPELDLELPAPIIAAPTRNGIMAVTPAIAAGWLEKYNTHNRPIKPKRVASYTRDMVNGRWVYDGMPIRWGVGDVLLDGQNRLAAVRDSGRAQKMMIVVGLPVEAQKVMDQGAPRSVADNLHMAGYKNRMVLGATARLGVLMDLDPYGAALNNSNFKPTVPEQMDWVDDHPEILEFVNYVASLKDRYRPFPSGVMAWAMWRLSQVDPQETDRFFADWREKRTQGAGDPLFALMDRIDSYRNKNERRMVSAEFLNLIFRAWNARHKGEQLRRMLRNTTVPIPVTPRKD